MSKRMVVSALIVVIAGLVIVPGSPQAAGSTCYRTAHNFARADFPHVGKIYSATLDVPSWCRRGNRLVNVHYQLLHKIYKSLTFGSAVKFTGFDGQVDYPYDYGRRGLGSGYAIKAVAHFSVCEPTHNYCPGNTQIYLRTYLHYDGTCVAYATVTNGLGKNSDGPYDTNCSRGR